MTLKKYHKIRPYASNFIGTPMQTHRSDARKGKELVYREDN